MGAVWLAHDEVLGRQVAIKRVGMTPGGASPDLERAEREARLAARLNHPHVVAVFDLVADTEGQWLVMEYVDGVTLAGLVQRDGALAPDEIAPMVEQAADALAAAHEAGIVHRDVKPSNILVTVDGQVKLSDFGIARAEADASLTQTGLVTGSPAYLAPEVASGQSATDASDVWSLGATLFHALSGHPPYEVGDNLMGALYRIVHEEPPRLRDAGWLGPLLEATMTREPDERWPMARVRDYLRAGPDGSPVGAPAAAALPANAPTEPHAVPPPAESTQVLTPPRRASARRRSPTPWVLAAGLVLLVVLGAIAWSLVTAGDDDPRQAAPSDPASSPKQTGEPSDQSSSPAPTPTAEGIETFVADYLATATSDPSSSFTMLTPAFQRASGGAGGYTGYWSTIESAELLDVEADAEDLSVTYDVAYVKTDGSEVTDEVTLGLVYRNGRYLISEES